MVRGPGQGEGTHTSLIGRQPQASYRVNQEARLGIFGPMTTNNPGGESKARLGRGKNKKWGGGLGASSKPATQVLRQVSEMVEARQKYTGGVAMVTRSFGRSRAGQGILRIGSSKRQAPE